MSRDTIYKRGDFLIEVSDKTHLDIVRQGTKLRYVTSKGDTLFESEKYVVLGDNTNITVLGLYKRFHLKQKFSNFLVPVYKGTLAKPDFKTDKDAYLFRTQIRDQCKEKGINFAGHYTIAMWGCGSPCQQIAIIDRINGKIYYSHIPQINGELGWGLKYRANSRLVIVNTDLLEEHRGYVNCSSVGNVILFEWLNNKTKRLQE